MPAQGIYQLPKTIGAVGRSANIKRLLKILGITGAGAGATGAGIYAGRKLLGSPEAPGAAPAADAGSKLVNWYQGMGPGGQTALRGLAGALAGGGLLTALRATGPRDPEESKSLLFPAATGALLGGTAAAALPIGLRYLLGQQQLSGEKTRPGPDFLDRLAGAIVRNPGKAIGGGAALAGVPAAVDPVRWARTPHEADLLSKRLGQLSGWGAAGFGKAHKAVRLKKVLAFLARGAATNPRLAAAMVAAPALGVLVDRILKGRE